MANETPNKYHLTAPTEFWTVFERGSYKGHDFVTNKPAIRWMVHKDIWTDRGEIIDHIADNGMTDIIEIIHHVQDGSSWKSETVTHALGDEAGELRFSRLSESEQKGCNDADRLWAERDA